METIMEEAKELTGKIINQMSKSELNGLAKALGWDKETELAKLPDYYGIKGIKFIWHNCWADPEIEYKGRRCSCYCIEDVMWDRWTHDENDNFIPEREKDEDGFCKYMLDNADEVYELCETILFSRGE